MTIYKLFLPLLLLFIFTGCSQKNVEAIKTLPQLKLDNKFLILSTASLDNKQNINTKKIIDKLIIQLNHNSSNTITKEVLLTEYNTIQIKYYHKNIHYVTYSFDYKQNDYKKASTLYFTNFKQEVYTYNKDIIELIQNDFITFHSRLDKLYFEEKKVVILINDLPTILTPDILLKRFKTLFNSYQDNIYENIYLIPFENRLVPTYVGFMTDNQVHLRSYIPYTLNTKSGATLSSYKLYLFKHKLQSLVND